jgi:hypothetical protein
VELKQLFTDTDETALNDSAVINVFDANVSFKSAAANTSPAVKSFRTAMSFLS